MMCRIRTCVVAVSRHCCAMPRSDDMVSMTSCVGVYAAAQCRYIDVGK